MKPMNEQKRQAAIRRKMRFFGVNRIVPYIAQYRYVLLLMIVNALLGSGFDIAMPLFQEYAINHFIGGSTLNGFPVFILVYICALIVQVTVNLIAIFGANYLEHHISRDLRRDCFHHLQELSFSYYNQNSVGYIHSRVMSDTSGIGETIVWSTIDGIWHCTYIVGALVVMFLKEWRLALVVSLIVPLIVVLVSYFEKRLVGINRRIREQNSVITGKFNEGITGAKTIKTLAVEEKINGEFRIETEKMRSESVNSMRFRSLFYSLLSFASFLILAIVLWQGGTLTLGGMPIGTLSVFMTYAIGIADPILWVAECISNLIGTKVNIERTTNLLATEPDVKDSDPVVARYGDAFDPKTENWEPLRGDIELRDVTFRYPDGDENVLEHFNLKVPFGTNVAIVGETGAGKSTLVNLVCRFFEPTDGQILIDGRDIRERSQLWMHRNIGYVLQTPHLFSGTIRENLCYGNPDAEEEEIRTALRMVGAEEIVDAMEDGLDSKVGESGDLLSTGEKQLISFARAILANPRILVLDEATSSIDTLTEQRIQQAIGQILKGRTSFVIAHRLSTIRDADVILVVRDGRIIETGTHNELMAARGYYYDLQRVQQVDEALGWQKG